MTFVAVMRRRRRKRSGRTLAALFEKREVMIPVRDGVKLHTEIYTPKNAKEPLPILFERTPYGISAANKGMSYSLLPVCAQVLRMDNFLCFRIFAGDTGRRANVKCCTPFRRTRAMRRA